MASGASSSHNVGPPAVSQREMGTRDAVPAGPSDTNPPAVSQGAGISNKVRPLTYNIGGTNTFPTQFAEFEDKLR